MVWKMKWRILQIFTRVLERVWWGSLILSSKSVSLNFTKELCVMTMKNDAKFGGELTCRFKIDMRNWQFWLEQLKISKIFTLMCSFRAKYILVELKKYRGVIFHDIEEWYKMWRGIDLSFQNWHEEFDRFWPEHLKVSKSFTLMGSFWTKYILFELKKYRGVIFHDTEE